PWRLAKLTAGMCYIGISFYRDLRNPHLDLETSMAQVFTHSGDGFVLRGEEVVLDSSTKEAHLTKTQAASLLKGVLQRFTDKTHAAPARVVLHKTSRFSEDERDGFQEALGGIPYDFVAILPNSPLACSGRASTLFCAARCVGSPMETLSCIRAVTCRD
ncbi:MAG: hypothetical protein ACYCVV_21215, partial [Acidimicrobiales bacterium]